MTNANKTRTSAFSACVLFSVIFSVIIIAGCDTAPKHETPAEQKSTTASNESRVSFDQLFDISGNNVTPKKVIRYSGKTFTPDVPFDSSVVILDGAPFTQLIGHDAEIRKAGDVTEIIRFY